MKKVISLVLSLCILMSFFCTTNFQNAQAAPSQTLISFVKDQHPRIWVDDFDLIREKIATYPVVAQWYAALKQKCDEYLELPAYDYPIDKLEQVSAGGTLRRIIQTQSDTLPRFIGLSFVAAIEEDEVYLNRLIEEIDAAIKLPCWNTAHWLETGELLQSFAIAYDWCFDLLSEEKKTQMEDAMVKFGLKESLREYAGNPRAYVWHYGFNDEVGTNWTAVCNSGVIMASIALCDVQPELCEETLNYAIKSIKGCANEFIPDGGYAEGIGYWAYGSRNLIKGAAALDSAFDGDFSKLPPLEEPYKYNILEYEGVAELGNFALYLQGMDGAFNTGDASPDDAIQDGLFYMGDKLDRPDYTKHLLDRINTNQALADALAAFIIWFNPEQELILDNVPLDNDFHLGVSSMRNTWAYNDNTMFVAMKSGINLAPHSHYDIGTFCLDALGERWIKTPGAGGYDWPGYMGQRWLYYVGRPEGQNTLVINPDDTAGQALECETEFVKSESGYGEAYFIYDMSAAYAAYAESVMRGIRMYDDRSRVLIQDEITFSEPENDVYWFAHTLAEADISEDGKEAILQRNGKKMFVRLLSPANAELSVREAAPMLASPNPGIQAASYGSKLSVVLNDVSDKTTLAVEFIPLPDDMAPPPYSDEIIPLEKWTADEGYTRMEDLSIDVVAMLEGSSIAYANSQKKDIDPDNPSIKPIMANDRTMVPLRFISENIGGEISWNPDTMEATVLYNHVPIVVKIGSDKMTVGEKTVTLDSPAFTEGGRTYVPLRAISEAMGKYVSYKSGLILISDVENPYVDYPEYEDELRKLLKYNVIINGESCKYFNPSRLDYSIFSQGTNRVKLDVAGEGIKQEKTGNEIYMNIAGESYLFEFTEDFYTTGEAYPKLLTADSRENLEFIPEGGSRDTHLNIARVFDSANDGNVSANMVDNYLGTRWSAQEDAYVVFELEEEKEVTHAQIAWTSGAARQEIFDILTSTDGEEWTIVYQGRGSGTTTDMQLFELEPTTAKYIKYQGHGNSANTWNSVAEARFYESVEDAQKDAEDWNDLYEFTGFSYNVGQTYHFVAKLEMSDGEVIELIPREVKWDVSDNSIAYIDADGQLEIFQEGSFNVYATYNEGKYTRTTKVVIDAN
ncbi:MAG: discoidin domain-containing protein [Clostridia bacterium]|nr:discoidin domain-containing protein [Clostridia bacterium]